MPGERRRIDDTSPTAEGKPPARTRDRVAEDHRSGTGARPRLEDQHDAAVGLLVRCYLRFISPTRDDVALGSRKGCPLGTVSMPAEVDANVSDKRASGNRFSTVLLCPNAVQEDRKPPLAS